MAKHLKIEAKRRSIRHLGLRWVVAGEKLQRATNLLDPKVGVAMVRYSHRGLELTNSHIVIPAPGRRPKTKILFLVPPAIVAALALQLPTSATAPKKPTASACENILRIGQSVSPALNLREEIELGGLLQAKAECHDSVYAMTIDPAKNILLAAHKL